jgi:beta-galactosidase
VPTALDLVKFDVAGPAEWRGGIAQGDSSGKTRDETSYPPVVTKPAAGADAVTTYAGGGRGEDNYILSRDLPVEAGINRVAQRHLVGAGGDRSAVLALESSQVASRRGSTVTVTVRRRPEPVDLLEAGQALGRFPAIAPPSARHRPAARPCRPLAGVLDVEADGQLVARRCWPSGRIGELRVGQAVAEGEQRLVAFLSNHL